LDQNYFVSLYANNFQSSSKPVLIGNFSLCGWKYMLGHFAKSVESYLWCSCNSYLNPGNCNSLNISDLRWVETILAKSDL